MADETYEVELKDGSTLQIMHFSKEQTPLIRKMKVEAARKQRGSQTTSKNKKSKKRKQYHEADSNTAHTTSSKKCLTDVVEQTEPLDDDVNEPWTNSPIAKRSRCAPGSDQYLSSPIKSTFPKSKGGPVSTSSPPPQITPIHPHAIMHGILVNSSTQTANAAPSLPEQVFLLSQIPCIKNMHTPTSSIFAESDLVEQPEREVLACYTRREDANEAAISTCLKYAKAHDIEEADAKWRDMYDIDGCLRLMAGWTTKIGPGIEVIVEKVLLRTDAEPETGATKKDFCVEKAKFETVTSAEMCPDLNSPTVCDAIRRRESVSAPRELEVKAEVLDTREIPSTTRRSSMNHSTQPATVSNGLNGSSSVKNETTKEPSMSSKVFRDPTPVAQRTQPTRASTRPSSDRKRAIPNKDGRGSEDENSSSSTDIHSHSDRNMSSDSDHNAQNSPSPQPHLGLKKAATINLPQRPSSIKSKAARRTRVLTSAEKTEWQTSKRSYIQEEHVKALYEVKPIVKKQRKTWDVLQNLWPVPSSSTSSTAQKPTTFNDVSSSRSHGSGTESKLLTSNVATTTRAVKESTLKAANLNPEVDLIAPSTSQHPVALPTLARGGLFYPSTSTNAASVPCNVLPPMRNVKAKRRRVARKEKRLQANEQQKQVGVLNPCGNRSGSSKKVKRSRAATEIMVDSS